MIHQIHRYIIFECESIINIELLAEWEKNTQVIAHIHSRKRSKKQKKKPKNMKTNEWQR